MMYEKRRHYHTEKKIDKLQIMFENVDEFYTKA